MTALLLTMPPLPASEPVVPPLPICSVPAETVVAPVYVLVPDSVSAPVPILETEPAPLIAPAKTLVPTGDTVSAPEPRVTAPDPDNPRIDAVNPLRSNVPDDTNRSVVVDSALLTPARSAPPFTVVVPL